MKQVLWLGKFLSPLGMPRFTLEMHLRETARALDHFIPNHTEKHMVLIQAAQHLEQMRLAVIPLLQYEKAILHFEKALREDESGSYKNLSQILLSAIADERIDQSGALSKTLTWMIENSQWPKHIVQACQSLVADLASS